MTEKRENRTSFIVALCLIFLGAILLMRSPFHWGWGPSSFLGFFSLTGVLNLLLAIWVGVDASRREMSGVLWGTLVFFTSIVGLIVYLIVVQSPTLRNGAATALAPPASMQANGSSRWCGTCGARLQSDYRHCPYCGSASADGCASCGRPVDPDWKACPQCGGTLGGSSSGPPAPGSGA